MTAYRRAEAALDVIEGPRHHLGEQPVWCESRGLFAYVDLIGQSAWVAAPGAPPRLLVRTKGACSGIVPVPDSNDWWVADGRAVSRCTGDGAVVQRLSLPSGVGAGAGVDWRLNGIGLDPSGALWAGVFSVPAGAGRGGLFRIDDGSPMPWTTSAANGFTWDEEGTCWHIDTLDRVVWRWQADEAAVAFTVPTDVPGRPDGLAFGDGAVRMTMWDGGCLLDVDPDDGRIVSRIDMPVSRPTALCRHPDGGWLVTTAHVSGERLSGHLLHLRMP